MTTDNKTDTRGKLGAHKELNVQSVDTINTKKPLLKRPWFRWALGTVAAGLTGAGAYWYESTHYDTQTWHFTGMNRGEHSTKVVTTAPLARGPYAERTGYAYIPQFVESLNRNYDVSPQNPHIVHTFLGIQLYTQYTKKPQTGFVIRDDQNADMYKKLYPHNVAGNFAKPITETICFIEDRDICDPTMPTNANPAFNGLTTVKAFGQSIGVIPGQSGASTLLVQNTKYDESPKGATIDADTGKKSFKEKIRQWASASRDGYAEGEDTRNIRPKIIQQYLNSAPFAAVPGVGEVHGLEDALKYWFDTDLEDVDLLLSLPEDKLTDEQLKEVAVAYRKVLTLELSLKMGSRYLQKPTWFDKLQKRADFYSKELYDKGKITNKSLAEAIAKVQFNFADLGKRSDQPEHDSTATRKKEVDAVRVTVAEHLGLDMKKPGVMHDMDKFDIRALTTLDQEGNDALRTRFQGYKDPKLAEKAGITGDKKANPALLDEITYSMLIHKSTEKTNDKLVQVDTDPRWLDISSGTQLQMGSFMKPIFLEAAMRAVIYPEHKKYQSLNAEELKAEIAKPHGPLTLWVLQHLASEDPETDKSSEGTLDAFAFKMKKYSTNPNESFFTGGGVHRFKNYRREDDGVGFVTMAQAIAKSYNMPPVRLLADHVKNVQIENMGADQSIYTDLSHPQRARFIETNAHTEGTKHLAGYWLRFEGMEPQDIVDALIKGPRNRNGKTGAAGHRTPAQAAVIFRSVYPQASLEEFKACIDRNGIKLPPKTDLRKIYDFYSPSIFTTDRKLDPQKKIAYLSLMDRGHVASMNGLALTFAAHMAQSPVTKEIERLEAALQASVRSDAWIEKTTNDIKELKVKRWDRESWKYLVQNTAAERLAVEEWKIKPKAKLNAQTGQIQIRQGIINAQNKAIRTEMENEAFVKHVHPQLVAVGYPFPADNFSLAAVLGGVGHTQAAVAKFLSIMQHDGKDVQDRTITHIEIAPGIKTFNRLATARIKEPVQVQPVEVSRVMKRVMRGSAEFGTLHSIQRVFETPVDKSAGKASTPVPELEYIIEGKTGTSRNEKYKLTAGGRKTVAESKSLTSNVMIMVTHRPTGRKYQIVMMAFVEGEKSAKHKFSSALSLAVIKDTAPIIKKLIEADIRGVITPELKDIASKDANPVSGTFTIKAQPQTQVVPSIIRLPGSATKNPMDYFPKPKEDFTNVVIPGVNDDIWLTMKPAPLKPIDDLLLQPSIHRQAKNTPQ